MSEAVEFVDDVRVALAAARAKAADGLTLAEFGETVYDIMRIAVEGLEDLPESGAQKKAWAIDAVGAVFDTLADRIVPIYAFPIWLLVKPSVRSVLIYFCDGAIESVLRLVREEK